MPATSRSRKSSGSSRSSKAGGKDSTALFAVLGLCAAGGAYMLFKPKTASAAELPGSSSSPSTASKKPAAGKPTSELSEELKQQMAEVLGMLGVNPLTGQVSGLATADAIRNGSQLVGTLDAMGFKEAAAALRKYVDEAAKHVQTPAEAKPIAAALPAGLSAEQRDYVARVMSLEREPDKIALLIDWLRKLSPSAERDTMIQMAQALALQLAAAQSTAATMAQIDQVIKAPNATQVQQASSQPLPPAYVPTPTPTAPKPSVVTSPGIANVPGQSAPQLPPTALPETPLAVPSKPVAQPVPVPATPVELAAKAMVANLLALQKQLGVLAAKGKEDKNLVKKFQALASTTPDGMAGPATLILAAGKGAVELPLVYYWPKTATATTVKAYRDSLEKLAQKFSDLGRGTEASILRASIARENGQSGITGAAPSAPKPAAASPAATAAPAKPIAEVYDPNPSWPLLKNGSKDTAAQKAQRNGPVMLWQTMLVKGGFLPNAPSSTDGAFGAGTTAATKKLQAKAGMIPSAQDGVVGPNTRKAANYLGLW